ncbi:MAG: hypothetical protein ACYDAN_04340 [Candidatus Limnocylindrales bacterium]
MFGWLRNFLAAEVEDPLADAGLEVLFERFDRLGAGDLLAIGASVSRPSAELVAARKTALGLVTPDDERSLRRGHDDLVRWATAASHAMRTYVVGVPGSPETLTDLTKLRTEALPALEDALVAAVLSDRLDPASRARLQAATALA